MITESRPEFGLGQLLIKPAALEALPDLWSRPEMKNGRPAEPLPPGRPLKNRGC